MKGFAFGEEKLTIKKVMKLAHGEISGILTATIKDKVEKSAMIVRDIANSEEAAYGINTGFGPLCQSKIPPEDTLLLQKNILTSHSVGVGEPIPNEVAKIMLILKLQSLSFGFSGIGFTTLQRILWHIDNNVIPVVPKQGSVGASGDLAPLAHLFLPLIGFGEVEHEGKVFETRHILEKFNLKPLNLGPKEGLALINGTQFISAFSCKVLERMHNCLDTADIIGALSLEAMMGSTKPFSESIHRLRPFTGCQYVAMRLREFLKNSDLAAAHLDCDRVQDPYSLRCMPQVHGASRESWLHLKNLTEIEINSVTDNPIILNQETVISGGNFHGQPLALPIDYTCVGASELGNISDRRTYLLLEGKHGLPPLLMKNTGINSGFMIPQYTSAALVSENKSLCYPASADSIPTSVGQEDHVSMGSIGARKAHAVVDNLEKILAVELLCAAQAFDYRRPLKSTPILEIVHELVRDRISHAEQDRIFGHDLERARQLIANKEISQAVDQTLEECGVQFEEKYAHDFALT